MLPEDLEHLDLLVLRRHVARAAPRATHRVGVRAQLQQRAPDCKSQSGTVTVVQSRAWVEGLGLQSAAGGWDCCGTGIAVPCRGQGLFMIGDCSPEPKKGTEGGS